MTTLPEVDGSPPAIAIRLARTGDYQRILVLLGQLNPADPPAGAAVYSAFESILQSPNLHLVVADINGTVQSTCYLNIVPNLTAGARPYAVIENVVTDAAWRNKGIGKLLLNRTVEMARSNHCYKVMLMSGRSEQSVHAFYRSCGFDADEKQAFIRRLK